MKDLRRILGLLSQRAPLPAIADPYRRTGEGLPPRPYVIEAVFDGWFTAATPTNGEGTNHATDPSTQWTYDMVEIRKVSAGYDGWTALDGGRSGTGYNFIEVPNTLITVGDGNADQRMGNGVILEHCDYDGDGVYEYAPQPATTGVPFRILTLRFYDAGSQAEYWFEHPNAIDGECG